MNIICVMGKNFEANKAVQDGLSNFGYTKGVTYTTEKSNKLQEGYKCVTEEQFNNLIESNILMEYTKDGDTYYGTAHPIGTSNYIVIVDYDGYKRVKEIYKDQVTGVYVNKNTGLFNPENNLGVNYQNGVEIVVDETMSADSITLDVLKYISRKRRGLA